MNLQHSHALLLLLLRCFAFDDGDNSCGEQSCKATGMENADAAAEGHAALLQRGRHHQSHNLSFSHNDAKITLTTTPSVQTTIPSGQTTAELRSSLIPKTGDKRPSESAPHNPHNNYWYWPWQRPANGNFEVGTLGRIPTHWQRFGKFGSTGLYTTEQARSGNGSVWFSGPGWELIETGSNANEKITVTKGSKYSVTFWARSTQGNQNIQTMFVVYGGLGASSKTRKLISDDNAQKFHYISAANTWQRFKHIFKAGEFSNRVRMNIGPHGAHGSLWIDDILFARDG